MREQTSATSATLTVPASVATCVKSATRRRAGACAAKSRPIRPPLRFAARSYPGPCFRAFAIGESAHVETFTVPEYERERRP